METLALLRLSRGHRRSINLPARQHCPRDARHLVGKRNRHNQGRSPRQKLRCPSRGRRPLACEPQNGRRADDQQPSNVWVALFGDAAQTFFPATRVLSKNEAEPGIPGAHRSGVVLAVDNIAVGESAGRSRPAANGQGNSQCVFKSFATVPKRITLEDIDDTFDAVHGGQQLRLFNAHYDEYGFQPIVVFDGEGRFVTAVLRRAAKRPSGKEIKPFLRRLLRRCRARLRLPAGDPAAGRQPLLRSRGSRLVSRRSTSITSSGIAPTATLRRHVEGLEASTKASVEAAPRDGKLRRFKEFFDGAQSWSRVERIIARVEAGAEGPDTRFVVTDLSKRNARRLYEDVYCRRGQAENHIKSWKTHLAADRASCCKGDGPEPGFFRVAPARRARTG